MYSKKNPQNLDDIEDILSISEREENEIKKASQNYSSIIWEIIEETRVWIFTRLWNFIKKSSSWVYIDLSLIENSIDFHKNCDTIFWAWYTFLNLDYDIYIELLYNFNEFKEKNSIIKISDDIYEIPKSKKDLYYDYIKNNWDIYLRFSSQNINIENWYTYVFEEIVAYLYTKWIKFWFDKKSILEWINNYDSYPTLVAKDLQPILPKDRYINYNWFDTPKSLVDYLESWNFWNLNFWNFKECNSWQIIARKIPIFYWKEWRDIYWKVIKIPRFNWRLKDISNFENLSWDWTTFLVLESWEEIIISNYWWCVFVDEKKWTISIKNHININWNISQNNWSIIFKNVNISISWDILDTYVEAKDIIVEWNIYWSKIISNWWTIKTNWDMSNCFISNDNWTIICSWNIFSQNKLIKSINWNIDLSWVLKIELSKIIWKKINISNIVNSTISWEMIYIWNSKNSEIIWNSININNYENTNSSDIFLVINWLSELVKKKERIEKDLIRKPKDFYELKEIFEDIYSQHRFLFNKYDFFNQTSFDKNMKEYYEKYEKLKEKLQEEWFYENLEEDYQIKSDKFIKLMEKIIKLKEIYKKIKIFLNMENDLNNIKKEIIKILNSSFVKINQANSDIILKQIIVDNKDFMENIELFLQNFINSTQVSSINSKKYIKQNTFSYTPKK